MEAPTEFAVVDVGDALSTIRVTGPLDAYTSPDLAALLSEHERRARICLEDVTFCDSSGIRVLIEAVRAGHVVDVESASRQVQRVVDVTAVRDLLANGVPSVL